MKIVARMLILLFVSCLAACQPYQFFKTPPASSEQANLSPSYSVDSEIVQTPTPGQQPLTSGGVSTSTTAPQMKTTETVKAVPMD